MVACCLFLQTDTSKLQNSHAAQQLIGCLIATGDQNVSQSNWCSNISIHVTLGEWSTGMYRKPGISFLSKIHNASFATMEDWVPISIQPWSFPGDMRDSVSLTSSYVTGQLWKLNKEWTSFRSSWFRVLFGLVPASFPHGLSGSNKTGIYFFM